MNDKMSPEEQRAWDVVEQRRNRFVVCMARVAMPGHGGRDDTCDCCGYPYLYCDPDCLDPCVICGWPRTADVDSSSGSFLGCDVTLTRVRLNFCEGRHLEGDIGGPEWEKLRIALDTLIVDENYTEDASRWLNVRKTFEALALIVWPNPGRMRRYSWEFAGLI